MAFFVLLYKDTENPLGFPDDYPANSINTDSDPGQPWVRMSKAEYDALVDKNRDAARALIDKRKSDNDASDAQKLDGLNHLFDKCDATAAIWATATRAQKDDFIEDFYKIIRRQKRQILDQYKPE